MPQTLQETYAFGAGLGNRLVFILDPPWIFVSVSNFRVAPNLFDHYHFRLNQTTRFCTWLRLESPFKSLNVMHCLNR